MSHIGCPHCAKTIPAGTAFCPHCGGSVTGAQATPAVPSAAPAKKRSPVLTLLGVLVSLMFVGMCVSALNGPANERAALDKAIEANPLLRNAPDTSPAAQKAAQASAPRLQVLAKRGYESESGGYYYVEGQVKNITNQPIDRLRIVATWFTKDGTFITTDQAMIDYDPLMPGQTSPFKTITRGNPQMSKFSIEFARLGGGTVAHEDVSK